MATTTSPARFLIAERPTFRMGEATFYLDEEHGVNAPRVGEVVEFIAGPDEDGDLLVRWRGAEYDIARADLVDIETVLNLIRSFL